MIAQYNRKNEEINLEESIFMAEGWQRGGGGGGGGDVGLLGMIDPRLLKKVKYCSISVDEVNNVYVYLFICICVCICVLY